MRGGWFTMTLPTPRGSRMCGKQRACGRVILDLWQLKELRAHFADVWQIRDLGESEIDSKGFRDGATGVLVGVWISKELAQLVIESKGVAGVVASDNVEDLSDFPEVWQAKGLEGEGQELGEGALTGGTGRGTIPPDMPLL